MKQRTRNSRAEQAYNRIFNFLQAQIIICQLHRIQTRNILRICDILTKNTHNQCIINIQRELLQSVSGSCAICAFYCILLSKIDCKTLEQTNLFGSSYQSVQILLQLQLLEYGNCGFQIFTEHVQISYQAVFQAKKYVYLDHFECSLEPRF
ncbi:Hypothetical_protein [Hexamita inflata]|uniref:Hypothetical_protein n=1 Tax=Hexamita inflata TaxID=28002 RepID=A0AA86TSP2_9EUKA|nr:Hypothetical protein HINF_LOCUS12977 [Hexamita inflata]